ncbi:MAG: cache domain-containing protein, partial [Anaerolineae bacterium]|nr:cache domain-containing protein [Anaerolineae bacterium]
MLRQKTGALPMYDRVMRLIIPVIMGTFLVIGLVLLFGIRATVQSSVTERLQREVAELVDDVNVEFQRSVADLTTLVGARDTRNFARETLINVSNITLVEAQNRMLGTFSDLLQKHANYLAIRYVTFNGSVWSEVTNYDDMIPRADAGVKLGMYASDPLMTRALGGTSDQVVVSQILFPESGDGTTAIPSVPFIRLYVPVAPDRSFDGNVAGVVQLDIEASSLLNFARLNLNAQAAGSMGRRILIADQSGLVLYDTNNPDLDVLGTLGQEHFVQLTDLYPDAA